MNISTTLNYARPVAAAAQPAPCTPTRPATEWWQVGDQRFDSTQDLINGLQVPAEGVRAEYHYKTSQESQQTVGDFVKSYAVNGAIAGAALGFFGAIAINVLGVAASILTAGFYGMFEGVGLLAPAAIGAVGGAAIGALSAREGYQEFQEFGNVIGGTVFKSDGQAAFHPYDDLHNRVDLNAHASAPVETISEGCTPWWQQRPEYR
ncbi:MAG: hypothetical protein AB1758_31440 [Candidatus Eremiobacterota bacterium]